MQGLHEQGNVAWRISTRSGGGDCVEVAVVDGSVAFRHSHRPDEGIIVYTASEWRAFVEGIKDGEFDDLLPLR
jgi:hypothetical protein